MATPPLSRSDLDSLELFAHRAADATAAAISPHFRQQIGFDNKAAGSGYDPVTIADRDAEAAIRALIAEEYPSHGILGEEFGTSASTDPHQWVIDPIDGTRAFVLGMPTWGTLIGLEHAGAPVLGVMDQPFTGERFWSSGAGTWYKGPAHPTRRLSTRRGRTLADALMATTDPALFMPGAEADGFARVRAAVRTCRYGTDCYAYCMLAMGLVDIVVEAGLKPYDIVALIPIIENAGGIVTTWEGEPAGAGGRILACGDPTLHAEVMALLA